VRRLKTTVILAASIGTFSISAALGASSWDHQANVAAALSDFRAAYKAGGVNQATQTMKDCYAGLGTPPDPQRTEYCVAFDLVEGSVESGLKQQKGWPIDEEFETQNQTPRVMGALGNAGIAEAARRPAVDMINAALMTAAQAPAASPKPQASAAAVGSSRAETMAHITFDRAAATAQAPTLPACLDAINAFADRYNSGVAPTKPQLDAIDAVCSNLWPAGDLAIDLQHARAKLYDIRQPIEAQAAADRNARAEAAASAWRADFKVFPADVRMQPYASRRDQDEEDACIVTWVSRGIAMQAAGGTMGFDTSNPFKNAQRQCVYIALCDLLDGKPNLAPRISQMLQYDSVTECAGVDLYAREFIASEPKTFEAILNELSKRAGAAARTAP